MRSNAGFRVDVERRRDGVVVTPSGELDLASIERLSHALAEHESAPLVVLDLRAITFLDTSGLRLVIGAHQRAEQAGVRLVLVRGRESVQRIFEVVDLERELPFVDDPDDALRPAG